MTFYRRNLPHWHPEGAVIFLTWRLFGSLPASVLKAARTARNGCATNNCSGKIFKLLDSALDKATTGPFWLKDPRIASNIVETLRKGQCDLGYFALHAFVVMPNHVHILISPHISVPRITNGIKGSTSHYAKATLSLKEKHFWQDESFDHWVRSPKEFDRIHSYIENNPVSAGLVNHPQDWPWSSGTAISGCAGVARHA